MDIRRVLLRQRHEASQEVARAMTIKSMLMMRQCQNKTLVPGMVCVLSHGIVSTSYPITAVTPSVSFSLSARFEDTGSV